MAEKISSKKLIVFRIIAAVFILACGEGLRRYLASFKKPPAKNEITEKVHTVKASQITKSDHLIYLEGYGIIQSSETVKVSSEISGIVTFINPNLEKGLTINKDEILFKIQEDDYKLAVKREKNRIQTIEAQIKELKTDISFSQKSLGLLQKQLNLAKNDLNRQEALLAKGIGSIVTKEAVEQAYIRSESSVLTNKQRIASSEAKINTLRNQIDEARVLMELNQNNLEKCTVKSPAKLRVISKSIEKGQLASPGMTLTVLENDENLEIPVMISGPDLVKWLNFDKQKNNIFTSLNKTVADIYWTESKNNKILAKGLLTRIENYDSGNRMAKGLVQITNINDTVAPGMFCRVKIAGKKLKNVFKVPRVSLNQNSELMIIIDDRLQFSKVSEVYDEGDFIYVSSEQLNESILVINNKLSNPITGLKVQIEAK